MNICLVILALVSIAGTGVVGSLRKRVALLEKVVATHVEVSRETLEVLKQLKGSRLEP